MVIYILAFSVETQILSSILSHLISSRGKARRYVERRLKGKKHEVGAQKTCGLRLARRTQRMTFPIPSQYRVTAWGCAENRKEVGLPTWPLWKNGEFVFWWRS